MVLQLKDARLMSLPIKQQRLLEQISADVIDDMFGRTENEEYVEYLKELNHEISRVEKYVSDPKNAHFVDIPIRPITDEEI